VPQVAALAPVRYKTACPATRAEACKLVLSLIGNILGFAAFGALLKLAGQKGHAPTPVAAVNYLLAAGVCGFVARSDAAAYRLGPVLVIGCLAGISYVVGFYLNFAAIERAGLSIAQPTSCMAVAIPMVASIAIYGERPTILQLLAIAVVGGSMLLVGSAANGGGASSGRQKQSATALLVGLFFVQGATLLAPKVLDESGNWAHLWPYLTILFATASAGACGRWVVGRDSVRPSGIGLGLALGRVNVAATALLSAALASLPAIVVYPLSSVGPMLLGMARGLLGWRERPSRRALAGVLLAVPAVVLLST